jgi:hypothetical protein
MDWRELFLKRSLNIVFEDNATKKELFVAEKVGFIALRYYPTKHQKKDFLGCVAVMLVFSNSKDDMVFVQALFDIEDNNDLQYVVHNNLNIMNLDEGTRNGLLKVMEENAKVGENSYTSDLRFSKHVNLLSTVQDQYKFDCYYSKFDDNSTVIQTIVCSKAMYLQISELVFWLCCNYPINPNVLIDDAFEDADIYKVTSLKFNGSAEVLYAGGVKIMANFTAFFNNGEQSDFVNFNVPCEPVKGKIEKQAILPEDYVKRFKKDITIAPSMIFNVSNPERMSYFISGVNYKGRYVILALDEETIKTYHWLDWGKHIYMSIDDIKKGK